MDIRRGSPTFGQWVGVELSAENYRQLYVPIGFAHGFCVLTDEAEVLYKTSHVYSPTLERGIIWNDPAIGVAWPIAEPLLSRAISAPAPWPITWPTRHSYMLASEQISKSANQQVARKEGGNHGVSVSQR